MELLASNITSIVQIRLAVPKAYRPVMDRLAITNWDTMGTVEGVEAEEASSIVHEPVIETCRRRNIPFQAVNHGIL